MQVVTTSLIVETLLTKGEVVLPDFGEGNRINLNDKSAIYKVIHSKIVKMNSKRILESELKGFNNREVLQSVLTDLGYRKYRGEWQK